MLCTWSSHDLLSVLKIPQMNSLKPPHSLCYNFYTKFTSMLDASASYSKLIFKSIRVKNSIFTTENAEFLIVAWSRFTRFHTEWKIFSQLQFKLLASLMKLQLKDHFCSWKITSQIQKLLTNKLKFAYLLTQRNVQQIRTCNFKDITSSWKEYGNWATTLEEMPINSPS